MRPEHTALVAIVQALWLGYVYLLVRGMDAAKSSGGDQA